MLKMQCMLCSKHSTRWGRHMRTRIPELRRDRKITQAELALAVGVTRQTITSIEVGKYTASLVLAYRISRYFGLTIEDVFDFSDVEGDDDDDQ